MNINEASEHMDKEWQLFYLRKRFAEERKFKQMYRQGMWVCFAGWVLTAILYFIFVR
jgi:hypothetical protein